MTEEISTVKSGQITYAVRDTVIDDKSITKGNLMGMGDQGLLAVGTDMKTVLVDTLKQMVDADSALISLYSGKDVTDEDAAEVQKAVQDAFFGVEVELERGDQPVYYYVFSVE